MMEFFRVMEFQSWYLPTVSLLTKLLLRDSLWNAFLCALIDCLSCFLIVASCFKVVSKEGGLAGSDGRLTGFNLSVHFHKVFGW